MTTCTECQGHGHDGQGTLCLTCDGTGEIKPFEQADKFQEFLKTGHYTPTMTTTDDPMLEVVEEDNGVHWLINFYVGQTKIGLFNLEHVRLYRNVHPYVLDLPVKCNDSERKHTVRSLTQYASDISI